MRDKKDFLRKKEELESWIKKLGLTKNLFAERVYYYMNNSDNEEEIKSFQAKFIKALQRDTTKIELLDTYLDILYEQPEFEKLGYIKPKNYFESDFDNTFNNKMTKISQSITEEITKKI
jgi:hypothetical protein